VLLLLLHRIAYCVEEPLPKTFLPHVTPAVWTWKVWNPKISPEMHDICQRNLLKLETQWMLQKWRRAKADRLLGPR
jgi:hypothetical protein